MDQASCQIGYVNMGLLEKADVAPMMSEFADKDAIVFDIRNYPNSTLWTLVNFLFENPVNVAGFVMPNFEYPSDFSLIKPSIGGRNDSVYQGRVMILMNESTISQAEYTIMGLEQHPNAVKIGSQTAAADGDITAVKLPGQITVYFTGLGVYYPDHTPTQRVGLIPDYFIRPSIVGIKQNKDEVLEIALDCNHVLDHDWPMPVTAEPGQYWDPKLSGKGFDILDAGSAQLVISYDYREDGSPVWYLGLADYQGSELVTHANQFNEFNYNYESELVSFESLPSDLKFDFKRGVFEVDCAVSAPEKLFSPAQLTWQTSEGVQTRCVQELIFSGARTEKDLTGLWNGGVAENGWGISVNTQGQTMSVLIYYYDEQGSASWLTGSDSAIENGVAKMQLLKPTGFCQTCLNNDVTFETIGQLEISLQQASNEFQTDNWVTIELNDSRWNRLKMPVKMATVIVD